MLNRVDIVGNPNVGVFILATDDVAIVPYSLLDEKAEIIKETLDVDVVKASISGSSLIGSLAVANSNGIVVSPHVLDREIEQFKKLGLNVDTLPGQYTAVGNIIAANDKGAIASPFLEPDAIQVIEETLDVDVKSSSIVGSDIIGSLVTVTNKGFLMSRLEKLGYRVFRGEHQAGTLSFLPGTDCEEAAAFYARRGIALRAGLHCAPLAHESAGTLMTGTVRVSFGQDTNPAQIRALLQAVSKLPAPES